MRQVDALIQDPAWLPNSYDTQTDAFVFAHVPRETQRRFVFLDPRFLGDAPRSQPIPLREISAALAGVRAQPAHFIFHTAFCCSTLLTRALDIPGVAMGLKEPSILVSLSDPRLSRNEPLDIALDLLSRPFGPGETMVVKPSNAVTSLAGRMLALKPKAKALILYSSLESYLQSSARMGMTGRAFNRQMFAQLAPAIPLRGRFTVQDLLLQTDLQIAAQVWLMQAMFLDGVAKQMGLARMRALKSTTLLADKAHALTRLGAFFGLNADAARWREIASGPVFDRSAKSLHDAPFDASAKQAVDAVHAKEISAVLPWVEAYAAHCGAPLDLGDTLMA